MTRIPTPASLLLTLLTLLPLLAAPAALAQDPLAGAAKPSALSTGEPDFLPVEQAYPLEVDRDRNGDLLLFWPIHEGYYLYKKRFAFEVITADGRPKLEAVFPTGIIQEDEFFGRSEVFYGELLVRLPAPQLAEPYTLEVRSQGCADAGLCYPPQKQYFEVGGSAGAFVRVDGPPAPADTRLAAGSAAAGTGSSISAIALMCLLAAAGGLILNLMPCVFPVLSLKVLSFAETAAQEANHKLLHGLVYSAGVVLSFLAVAALMLALRSGGAAIGWGFHLQAPWFVALLAYLFVAMGLSLSGLIEFGTSLMGAGNSLATRGGLRGSFFTGVLATVVASPCTAPFMGTALGFALTQSTAVALLIFASLGVGMALPFLLLALFPALLARLPRPGPWMLSFRQFMAFPLYGAAVWLLWVLGNQTGVNGMAAVAGGAVLLAMSLWFWSRGQGTEPGWMTRVVAIAVLAAALAVLRSPLLRPLEHQAVAANAQWEQYSAERVQQLRRAGQPYFINVTADWCLTCLSNERFALSDEAVRAAFKRLGITYLKGDWTNSDPRLTQLLRDNGRSGVPLYLLVDANGKTEILPQLLTPGRVLSSLEQLELGARANRLASSEISKK